MRVQAMFDLCRSGEALIATTVHINTNHNHKPRPLIHIHLRLPLPYFFNPASPVSQADFPESRLGSEPSFSRKASQISPQSIIMQIS